MENSEQIEQPSSDRLTPEEIEALRQFHREASKKLLKGKEHLIVD